MTNEACQWFIAIVANKTEASTAKWLEDRVGRWPGEDDYTVYLPMVNTQLIGKSGHAARKKSPAIPRFVFVRCTEAVRYKLSYTPNIKRWFMDAAAEAIGKRRVCTVPDATMDAFKRFIEQTNGDCQIESRMPRVGTRMRFVSGPFEGFSGTVEESSDSKIVFRTEFGILGSGSTVIDKVSVEKWMEVIND